MKLFDQVKDFPYIRWAEGFLIGMAATASIASATPPEVIETRVEVPVVQVERVPVRLTSHDEEQIQCMARNAYFEALGEPERGVIAVNNVVMNRVEDGRFPRTPCGVINQRTRNVCQFSWRCEGNKRVTDMAAYRRMEDIAEDVYLGNTEDVTGGAQFYHANYVRPSWSRVFDRTTQIGAHIFYRG